MEPFTIQCSTCQSKIRVKSARMLGQVANCPKCNSMILIAAPEGETAPNTGRQIQVDAPGGLPVDSMAMTKEGIDPGLQSADGTLPADSELGEEYRLSPAEAAPAHPAQDPTSAMGSATHWSDEAEPLVPSDAWTSASSAKSRQYLLVGILGFTSLALAAVGFIAFLRWYGSDTHTLAQQPAATQASPVNSVPAAAPSPDPSAADPSGEGGPPGTADSATADSATADSATGDAAVDANTGANVEPVSTQPTDAESAPPNDPAADSGESVPPEITSLLPDAGGDPSELPLDLLPGEAPDPEAGGIENAPLDPKERAKQNLPNANLKEFAPVLDWQVQPVLSTADVPTGPPPVTAEDLGLANTITRTPVPDVNLTDQLKLELPGLILPPDLPLSSSLNLWCHLSAVPLSVDLESLDAANLDVSRTPDLGRLQSASLGSILDQLATGAGLEVQRQAGQYLHLRASESKLTAMLPSTMPVGDLVDEPQQAWLRGLLAEMIPGTEDGWTLEGGALSYHSERVDLLAWARALRILESWRSERGLPTKLTDYAAGRMRNHFVAPEQVEALAKPLAEVMLQEAPVGQTLARLCSRAGLDLWIDWPKVGQHGLGPMTSNLVILQNRTLEQVLANFAHEYGLVFYIQNAGTLCLTTPAAYRSRPEVFVLPSQGKTAEQWQQQLRLLTPTNAQGISELKVTATPDQEFVIVACCRPALRESL